MFYDLGIFLGGDIFLTPSFHLVFWMRVGFVSAVARVCEVLSVRPYGFTSAAALACLVLFRV